MFGTCETGTGNGICTLRAAIQATTAAGDPMLRQSFIDDGTPIGQALGALRNAVQCPVDAPPA